MNIALFLQMAAEACPDRRALTHDGTHYTYAELFSAAKRAAFLFSTANCKFVSMLDTSSPAYLISGPRTETYDFDGWVVQDSNDFLNDVLTGEETEVAWNEDPAAVAVQLFTSGTTGIPKAALLRHEHLVAYILGSVEFMGALEDEATLVSAPPYHLTGISAVMSNIYACRQIVQLANFDAAEWIRLVAEETVTSVFVVPTMLTRIIETLDTSAHDSKALSSLTSIA